MPSYMCQASDVEAKRKKRDNGGANETLSQIVKVGEVVPSGSFGITTLGLM